MFSSSAVKEDVAADLAALKRKGICKAGENRKEICAAAKGFYETALLGTAYRHYEKVCICTVL